MDNQLSFDSHIRAVCRSCNYHIRALSHIRNLLPFEIAQTLACSIVGTRIDYCNALLVGAPKSTLSKLQRIQNNLARVVLQMPRRTHADPLLYKLHWLPVEHRVTYKLALLTHKVQSTATPQYLNVLLKRRICDRTLRSSDMLKFDIPRVNTVIAGRAFRVAAPTVWNSLPRHVSSCSTVTSFKKQLKTHLFNIAFKQFVTVHN